MAAYGIKSSVYILPNPDSSEVHHRDLNNITVAQRNLTFRFDITHDILTLYLGPAQRGDDISGLAYVPSIDHHDPCFHGHVPENATQFDDLPPLNFDLIGYAPWVSANCSRRFLDSAAADMGNTKAVVFYTVTNGNKAAVMPSEDDPMWHIGAYAYQFPIYAINGVDGEPLMEKISRYSRNITDIWESPGLKDKYGIEDYARVYIEVNTGSRNPLPGLWLFLLIVLGVLIFIFGFTSMVMHWIQHRRRVALRRRLASGEMDLETMGVKRLTVPLVIIRKFPIKTYQASRGQQSFPEPHTIDIEKAHYRASSTVTSQSSPPRAHPLKTPLEYTAPSSPLPPSPVFTKRSRRDSTIITTTPLSQPAPPDIRPPSHAFTQTNCAICLEEYESGITVVRELPCLHIFHPECIDAHLTANSSLCPLCKASVLPKGYVPANLTNQTVRRERNMHRERNMRRMRERYAQMNANVGVPVQTSRGWLNAFVLPSYLARRGGEQRGGEQRGGEQRGREQRGREQRGGGRGEGERGRDSRGHDGHGQFRRRSFSEFASVAPTQDEEDEEWRNMSLLRRFLKQAFPR